MSWLNAIAPANPMAAAIGMTPRPRLPRAWTASTKPNAPAATSSTLSVGCRRNDSSVVRANVASIDSRDHR
ncbi:Uncharacterised protein [Mycobacterium tuberculosis]|uniref:Uncharacterized protein n=1 Tax=Mycobacterium tuberculosis TaxID=1773 RepID=A0A654U0Z3_MYCTX|nr:Uncharacterised protein [Mycobacterium tuberculosis]